MNTILFKFRKEKTPTTYVLWAQNDSILFYTRFGFIVLEDDDELHQNLKEDAGNFDHAKFMYRCCIANHEHVTPE